MSDEFEHQRSGLESPATFLAAITPHDTNELLAVPRAIYVGGTGDIRGRYG